MRKIRILTYIFLCILFSVPFLGAGYSRGSNYLSFISGINDTIPPQKIDSLGTKRDSTGFAHDSLRVDSVKRKPNALDAIVDYRSNDSIVLTAEHWAYLYGGGEVKYGDLTLKGQEISMNTDSSLVYAKFGLDSVGREFGFPVFSDRGTDLESKTMKYNFKTRKGFTTTSVTTQGEGYVIAGKAKKNEDNSFFMSDSKYTTCPNHEHPHFHLALTKAKVKPKKNVVTGPAYLVIEGLPLPIGLPFGFFPFSDKYSSGVIMPSYGDELDRGFNLRDGGYYFAINDHIDLAITGDIYTKGSWGVKATSNYRKRYKYSGNFNFNYLFNKYGEKGVDYSESKDLAINWSHMQDAKADMFRTFQASVQFSTSSYNQNSLDTRYVPRGTSNTKSSSVSLTQKIPNSPWSLSASMNIAQRSSDSSISMTLPNLMVTMSRIYPFKRKEAVGAEKWYEKIQLSYSGEFRNSIDTKENLLLKSNLQKDWKNAMKHSVPISATFTVFDYLNITPSINYNERWYTSQIEKQWDPVRGTHIISDTTYSFKRVYDFSTAISFQTKLYGMYEPIFSKTTRIRHVFTPSISLSYTPDFSESMWGFYKRYTYFDTHGDQKEEVYSPWERGMFGTAPKGAAGMVSFNFENNLEMKIASQSDSTGYKKISLIDNLSINFSHNLMADSLKWSDIGTNIRLKFSKSFVVNIGAVFDPYMYSHDKSGRGVKIDKLRISNGKGIGRLKSTGYSISPSINQDTFKKWFGGGDENDKEKKQQQRDDNSPDPSTSGESESNSQGSLLSGAQDDKEYDKDGYVKNEIKWSLTPSFSMNYGYGEFDPVKDEYRGRLTKSFSLSGSIQPTRNWNFSFNTSYDFDAKKISYMSCNLTRDLHCWSISASFNPVGPYKSYYVSLRASSSLLQDLKYEQRGRSSGYDPNWD